MNTDLLVVIPFHTGDGVFAERLCDWIFQLNGQKPLGHAILISDREVHAELQTKIKLSADLAFSACELHIADPSPRIGKAERINHLFRTAAKIIAAEYRWPWVWLEPDCVPLKPDWLKLLKEAYEAQPKRYLGPFLKLPAKPDREEEILMGRTAVYPPGASLDLDGYCNATTAYNIISGKVLVNRATKCKLFQQIAYNHETDFGKIRPDAAILHSDKTGNLVQYLRANLPGRAEVLPAVASDPIETQPVAEPVPEVIKPKRRGRPPKIKPEVTP